MFFVLPDQYSILIATYNFFVTIELKLKVEIYVPSVPEFTHARKNAHSYL